MPSELDNGVRKRGDGSIYRRGSVWWLSYVVNGRTIRESARTGESSFARALLTKRIAERNRREKQRRERRAKRMILAEFADERSIVEISAHSVRILAREMRAMGRPVPGVYFIRSGDCVKIGYASNLDDRLSELQTGNPVELEIVGLVPGPHAGARVFFTAERERGEWFWLEGRVIEFVEASKQVHGAGLFKA